MTPKKARSPKHPSIALEDALGGIEKVHKTHAHADMDSHSLATALGFTTDRSGAALRWLSSLRQFGLVEQRSRGISRVSELGKTAIFGTDAEQADALVRAVTMPPLYKALQEQFAGDELPAQRTVEAWLQRNGFSETAAHSAARAYLASMEFVNKMAERGDAQQAESVDEVSPSYRESTAEETVAAAVKAFGFSGALYDGNAFTFSSVRPMTEDDFEILEVMLAAQKMVALKRAPAESASGEADGTDAAPTGQFVERIDHAS